MPRRRISNTATATLESWLDQLLQGQLSIGELPLAVEAWLHVGHALGRESRQHEIDQLEREVNRLHYLAFYSPGERRERLLARLDQGLAIADEATWDQLEADLLHMTEDRQLNTDSLRAAPAARGETPWQQDMKKNSGDRAPNLKHSDSGRRHAA